jgi:hypothetical protein
MKIILAFFLLILLTIWSMLPLYGSENRPSEKAYATQNAPKKNTNPAKTITKNRPSIVNETVSDICTQYNCHQTENQKQKKTESPNEGWWHKLKDDPIATFTALLFISTCLLFWATWQLVRGAKETSIQQLRAYVFAGLDDVEKLFFNENGCLGAALIIKNYGQTPAYNLKGCAFIGFYKLPLSEILHPPNYSNGSLGCLAPNQIFRLYPTLTTKLSQPEMDAIKTGKIGIYVWGYLEYIDIFKIHRKTQFKMLSTSTHFDDRVLTYCSDGNEAT